MSDLEDELRATSESLLRDVDRLRELEEEKRSLDLRDPRLAELSARIEELAHRTYVRSKAEREIVTELHAEPGAGRTGAGRAEPG